MPVPPEFYIPVTIMFVFSLIVVLVIMPQVLEIAVSRPRRRLACFQQASAKASELGLPDGGGFPHMPAVS